MCVSFVSDCWICKPPLCLLYEHSTLLLSKNLCGEIRGRLWWNSFIHRTPHILRRCIWLFHWTPCVLYRRIWLFHWTPHILYRRNWLFHWFSDILYGFWRRIFPAIVSRFSVFPKFRLLFLSQGAECWVWLRRVGRSVRFFPRRWRRHKLVWL